MTYTNISAYKFLAFSEERLVELRQLFKERAAELGVRGTMLLSPEGINLFLAGEGASISQFQDLIHAQPEIGELVYKVSHSDTIPFKRLLIKIKKEIIAFRQDGISPAQKTAPYIEPEELKRWYDEGRDMLVLDTRNDYEARVGTFKNAKVFDIQQFVQFPEAVKSILEEYKNKPIVTFCTGGIRCEKAATYMQNIGFDEVYQLRDGILNYFEKVGGEHYDGDCFVFDQRVAVDPQLNKTKTIMCFACRAPISADEAAQFGEQCPYCQKNRNGRAEAIQGAVEVMV